MDLVDSNFWLRSSTEDLHVHVCLRLDRSENNHDLRLFSWRKSYFELDRSERRWLFTTHMEVYWTTGCKCKKGGL